MNRIFHRARAPWPLLVGVALLLVSPTPALACGERTGSWWDWERCYSGWRVLVLPMLAAGVLGTWCYSYLFLHRYLQKAKPPLWPREAFWRATAWYFFLLAVAGVLIFAAASDEWRSTQWHLLPSWGAWLDRNWPWMVVLVVSAVLAVLLAYLTRRKRRPGPSGVH